MTTTSHTTYAQPTLSTPTSRIYTSYRTPNTPYEGILPRHPGTETEGWTRFICISDTHSFTTHDLFGSVRSFNTSTLVRRADDEEPLEGTVGQVPPGDILLHAGDLSSWGELPQLRKTVEWIAGLEGFEYKVLIAGNHDLCLDPNSSFYAPYSSTSSAYTETEYQQAQEMMRGEEACSKGIVYLEYERQVLRTRAGREWIFYGSPAAPRYADGAFQYSDSTEAKAVASRIPPDVEILLTHTPAHGILDMTRRGKNAGCKYLLKHLQDLSSKGSGTGGGQLALHVFGHIHESRGAQIVRNNKRERLAVNAAMMSEAENALAIVVDLKN